MTAARDAATGAGLSTHLSSLCEGSEARAYASLVNAADAALGAAGAGFEVARQGALVMLRSTAMPGSLLFNRVLGLGLEQPASLADLKGLRSWYGALNLPFGVELSPAALPTELPDWLRAQRLRKSIPTQVLVRGAGPPPPHYAPWARLTGLRVEAVGPERAAEVARLSCENFSMPEAVGGLLTAGSQAPGWRRWLAWDGDKAVGASLSYVENGVGWLGWTSVLPSHRGRWVHAGIVAQQLQDTFEAGCQWVTTETAMSSVANPDPAYFNLRKFGFSDAYLRPVYVHAPSRRRP